MKEYLPRSWVNPKLIPGKSNVHGVGVFAGEGIARGEKLMEFGGLRISREQALSGDYRIRSVWPLDENNFLALPMSDPDPSLDENLNHSCDANAWLIDDVTITARRDIAGGEEITLDQGTWNCEDPLYIEDDEPCSCGSGNCRARLTEHDWKRPDLQERYKGHFHPMIPRL
jgi:hypothetical protein